MSDNALEDLRLIGRLGAKLVVEVLELDLLASEVVGKAAKGRSIILFAFFVLECVYLFISH